jgi:Galactose oxidase, central domain
MDKSCLKVHCKREVAFICNCKKTATYSCVKHFAKHLLEEGDHSSHEKLLISLDPKKLDELCFTILSTKSYFRMLRKKIQEITRKLIQRISKESSKLILKANSIESVYLNLFKNASAGKNIDKLNLKYFVETIIPNGWDIEVNITELDNKISDFYDIQAQLIVYNTPDHVSQICYFDSGSKNLNIVKVPGGDTRMVIKIPEFLDIQAGMCELPDNQCFYYGGFDQSNAKFLDIAYIINTNLKSAIKKASGKSKFRTGCCCYYKESVYVFGGINKLGTLSEAERYNIIQNNWESLTNLPIKSYDNSSVCIMNFIFVTGFLANCIYRYDPESNKYASFGELSMNSNKVMCDCLGKIYVFELGVFYETNYYCNQIFKYDFKTQIPTGFIISYPVKRREMIYFVMADKKIYRFDVLKKETSVVRVVNTSSIVS